MGSFVMIAEMVVDGGGQEFEPALCFGGDPLTRPGAYPA